MAFVIRLALAAVIATFATAAPAQTYPVRPIKLVVSFPPGGGPAALGVMAGDVAVMFGGGSVAPLVKSGKLRGLATSGPRRSPVLPDLPAIAEFYPGYEVSLWQGLFAPTGTPPAIVERLRTEIRAILTGPEYGAKLAAAGSGEPLVTTPEEFAARIRGDHEAYGRLIREIGAKVE